MSLAQEIAIETERALRKLQKPNAQPAAAPYDSSLATITLYASQGSGQQRAGESASSSAAPVDGAIDHYNDLETKTQSRANSDSAIVAAALAEIGHSARLPPTTEQLLEAS